VVVGRAVCRRPANHHHKTTLMKLQAFLSLDHLYDGARFKSWFYGTVLNVCRNWRREYRENVIPLPAEAENGSGEMRYPGHYLISSEEHIEQLELRMVLDDALDILPARNRVVTQLFYYEDLSIQEIAQRLNLSLTAVKNRLYRGRKQLHAHLVASSPEIVPVASQKGKKGIMIKVSIAKVVPRDHFRTLVMLQDDAQQRVLPIWLISWTNPTQRLRVPLQSQSDSIEPLTTDFIVNQLKASGGTISTIEIEELQNEVLYARVYIGQQRLKARLNDALPLALRLNSELYVSEEVMERLGQPLSEQAGEDSSGEIETFSKTLTDKTFAQATPGQIAISNKEPRNLDFSDGVRGWWLMGVPKEACTYQIDQNATQSGKRSLTIINQSTQQVSMIFLYHEGFLADNYLGKRLRLSADVKTEDVKDVRVGADLSSSKEALPLRQYTTPPIRGTTGWTRYNIIFDVSSDISFIKFSMRMMGKGKVWLAAANFEVVDSTVPLTENARQLLSLPEEPQNTHFAFSLSHWELFGSHPQDYASGIDTDAKPDNSPCGYIKSNVAAPRGHGIYDKPYEASFIRVNRYDCAAQSKRLA
jgi:RNA polymerase sigma factor (sigma-70 family)